VTAACALNAVGLAILMYLNGKFKFSKWEETSRKPLLLKHLAQGGRAAFVVTPYTPTTYSKLQNAMQNATRWSKMLHCHSGMVCFSREKWHKNIFLNGTQNALYKGRKKESFKWKSQFRFKVLPVHFLPSICTTMWFVWRVVHPTGCFDAIRIVKCTNTCVH
jgi:hypothetical protein